MRSRKGSAMIMALVVVMIAVSIAAVFLVDTAIRSRVGAGSRESDEAQMLCQSALEKVRRALYVYKTGGTYDWDQILADHADLSIDPADHWLDYLERRHDPAFVQEEASFDAGTEYEAPLPGDPNFFLGMTRTYAGGGFYVVIRDNNDGDGNDLVDTDAQLLVYVTASFPDGTQRQIESLVAFIPAEYTPDFAILVDANLRFNGNPEVRGARGKAHANGSMTLSGTPTFSVSASATGAIDEGSADTPPEGFQEFVDPVPIPDINPEDYRHRADFILRADGTVYDPATGQILGNGILGWKGWKYTGGLWLYSGTGSTPTGTYFIEGSAKLSGTSGAKQMTLLVTGSIETVGNIELSPVIENTLIVAGGDVKLGGTSGSKYQGLVAAREQTLSTGNFQMVGTLLAQNQGDSHSLISVNSINPEITLGGNIVITYDGGMQTLLEVPSSVAIRAMRRLK